MKCPSCNKSIQADSSFCKHCGQPIPQTATRRTTRRAKNANGCGYVYKRGSTWTVRFRKYAGSAPRNGRPQCVERTKGGFSTKAEAAAYLSRLQDIPKKEINFTVAYYWSVLQQDALPSLSTSKQINYTTAFSRMKPVHHRNVSDLTVADLRQIASSCPTYYPAHDIKVLFQKIFDLAAADNPSINHDLPSFIILPQKNEKEQQAFTAEEVYRIFLAHQNGHPFAGYILLMIYTSMMPGELLRLKRSMFDLPHHQIIGAGIKTKKRRNSAIVYPEWLSPVVQQLLDRSDHEDFMHDFAYYEKFYTAFKHTLLDCQCRPLTPYACRHTTQTILALDPTTAPAARAAVMRHSIQEEERYTHIEQRFARNAVNQMPPPSQLLSTKNNP